MCLLMFSGVNTLVTDICFKLRLDEHKHTHWLFVYCTDLYELQ